MFLRRQTANEFEVRLRAHFQTDPSRLPIVAGTFESHEHPNIQRALGGYLEQPGRSHELIGIAHHQSFGRIGLADLIAPVERHSVGFAPRPGPVLYETICLFEEPLSCISRGLYLVRTPEGPLAILVTSPTQSYEG